MSVFKRCSPVIVMHACDSLGAMRDSSCHDSYYCHPSLLPIVSSLIFMLSLRYRPTISLSFVLGELLFGTDEDGGKEFLRRCGVDFTPNGLDVACKTSCIDARGLETDAPNSLL